MGFHGAKAHVSLFFFAQISLFTAQWIWHMCWAHPAEVTWNRIGCERLAVVLPLLQGGSAFILLQLKPRKQQTPQLLWLQVKQATVPGK